jgi:hypothetical protein
MQPKTSTTNKKYREEEAEEREREKNMTLCFGSFHMIQILKI